MINAANRTVSGATLQAKPTTALSLADANPASAASQSSAHRPVPESYSSAGRADSERRRDDERAALRRRTTRPDWRRKACWAMCSRRMRSRALGWPPAPARVQLLEQPCPSSSHPTAAFDEAFECEFNELDDITSDGLNEEAVLKQWKSKLKQYFRPLRCWQAYLDPPWK